MAQTQETDVGTIEAQGERVPALGFGTWQMTGEECAEAVAHALSIGYRHIDTAQMYENEAQVGEGIRRSGVDRDKIFLTTKVAPQNLAREDAIRSTESSVEALGVDRVDLLLIHWPSEEVPLEETLDALQTLQSSGKTRRIGVSNFPPSWLAEARRHAEIFCDQVEYHPYLSQDHLLEAVRDKGLLMTAYSPLARGRVARDETIGAIAERHGKSPAQVTLRWILQQGVCAIPKASKAEHREQNFDIFDFALDAEEMSRISGLGGDERLIDPDWSPAWERSRNP